MRTAIELSIGRDPDAVPKARRFVASSLMGEATETLADVELVVSELVTNAVLHGRPPITVRLIVNEPEIKVEVEDTGPDLPVLGRPEPSSMTGRGLSMVASLSRAWGIDPGRREGKVVWADLGGDAPATPAGPPQIAEGLLEAARQRRYKVPTYTVRLDNVPTSLLLAAKAHIDNLVRELTLWRNGDSHPLPAEVLSLVSVTGEFAEAREEIKRQALTAAAKGELSTDLVLRLPASMAEAGERYLAALDEADRFARAARLLTMAPPLSHRTFRIWYVGSLVQQLRDLEAGRRPKPPTPLSTALADRLDELERAIQRTEIG